MARIGIDASRALIKDRTGIEEYSFQVINYLVKNLGNHEVILYLRKDQSIGNELKSLIFGKNVKIREIKFRRFWTQIGLAMDILINPVDVLFIPAHTIPWVHPKKTVVTIHGLEYEHCPESYSLYSRLVHRFFIKKSCRWAEKIIAVSKKTKKDLIELYKASAEKIGVVYNGFENTGAKAANSEFKNEAGRYLLYLGRLEKRKNVEGVVKTFEILKEKYNYKGKLILAGRPGFGYEDIKQSILNVKKNVREEIVEKGFIENEEKQKLLTEADLFLFPSLAEGFGIPILEAQSAGVPVITSNYGPMDEIAGDNNILVNPKNPEEIAQLADKFIRDKNLREKVIQKGLENAGKFSWQKCGKETAEFLLGK